MPKGPPPGEPEDSVSSTTINAFAEDAVFRQSPVSDVVIGERFHVDERSARERLAHKARAVLRRCLAVLGLSTLVLPLFLIALITLDLPLGWFDGWAGRGDLAASNWMSRGEALLAGSVFLLLFMTRRHGGILVSRAQSLSWLLAICAAAAMLAYLAPQLTQDDLPGGRYVIGIILSWYVGQQVAIHIYDATRGGQWWRAPFYGALFGFGVQVLLFFPVAYGATSAPWASWMFLDFSLKILASAAFLLVYHLLRRRIRPRPGLGGR